jgi:two-component system, NtrC family, response regulator AtoC
MARSVLLIDDDAGVLNLLARIFERKQWEVFQAMRGDEGVRLYDLQQPDVVLLDLHLPGISGMNALELLVARGATVIMLTGHAEVETAVEAMQLGAESFLTKPVNLIQLDATVERTYEKVELRRINQVLASRLAEQTPTESLGVSPRMQELARHIERVAASSHTTVLLLGESGTGKSMIAEMIHARSPRARGPFVEINCASLSGTFLASELFGHEKGAFTDAKEMKRGLFEVADGGTLFMDEIGDLAAELQPKLLNVLESQTFRRLGSTREIKVDVRLIAATNKDLAADSRARRFREDLYYRLSVFPLTIPALRGRSREDLLTLVQRLLQRLHPRHPNAPLDFSARALDLIIGYAWPGNVRELRNALERALVLAVGSERIEPEHLPPALRPSTVTRAPREDAGAGILTLEELERQYIERALFLTSGNRTVAAEKLGISRATLHNKIKSYGLQEVGRE